jgi:ATP-binding cassette subfamily F protein 3
MSFGAVDLFGGISVSVNEGERIGMVGPNGIGKTTLLLALVGRQGAASGSVNVAKDARIGYLPQEAVRAFEDTKRTVHEELLAAFRELREVEVQLAEMEHEIAEGHADDELVERYGETQERFELGGGYDYHTRIKQVLTGLALDGDVTDRPLVQLSGGQKTRVLLGRRLLERPDLLVLDEPTNHLDIAAVEWLEGMLATWEGAVLVVSHDRYFLDRVATKIWEMGRWGMETYRGNYSAYLTQREERWERRGKRFEEVKLRLEKELDYVRRNIAGQRTSQAKGKLARLAREVEAIHAGGLEIVDRIGRVGWLQATHDLTMERPSSKVDEVGRRIGELRAPSRARQAINVRMKAAKRSGDIVLRTKGLVLGYPGTPLANVGKLELRRQHIVALLGPNGSGKTTFLKTLLEQVPPLEGEIKLGASLELGYFAQAHEGLDKENTVLDELMRHHKLTPGEARGYLAGFLFRGDDVFKRVSALSGGERGRLALSILARRGANFLILDEPTNHLDIPAQEVLQAVLESFDGTVLMVTHDRYLVDRLATRIWTIEDGRLEDFDGSYQRMLAERASARDASRDAARDAEQGVKAAASDSGRSTANGAAPGNTGDGSDTSDGEGPPALSKNERRRLEKQMHAIENDIAALEQTIADLAEEMQEASAEGDYDEIQRIGSAHDQTTATLTRRLAEWEELAATLV